MKNWILISLLLLTACSSSPQRVYYQLPQPEAVKQQMSSSEGQQSITVEPMVLSDFLSGSGVAYQTSDVRYVMANQHQWAGSLAQQLHQALLSGLSAQLPDWRVSDVPFRDRPSISLTPSINGFHGRYDGRVVIQGSWRLQWEKQQMTVPFHLVLPQSEDGYDDLVKTLGQGWQQVIEQLAKQLPLVISIQPRREQE